MSRKGSPLNFALRRAAKEVAWKFLHRHQPDTSLPDVAIFSSRRGGSTLLMEVLSVNRGMSFSDQPYSLYTASEAQLQVLPLLEYGQIISPDRHELDQVFEYTRQILDGRLVVNGPWKFWKAGSNMRTSRMILKITDAKSIAQELAEQFGLSVIVMTRHPISQSLSVERNGWETTARAFLRNRAFTERWLPGALLEEAWAIARGPDPLARRVLDWTLENLPLIDTCRNNPDWLFLSYEELVLKPEESITRLARHCRFDDEDAMLAKLLQPSRSTKRSSTSDTKRRIAEGNAEYIARRWRQKIDTEQEQNLLAICHRFGLNIYAHGEDIPYLHGQ